MENPFLEEGEDSPLESRGGVDAVAGAESSERHEEHDAYDKDIAGSADWEDYLGDLSSAPKLASSREYELSEEISSLEARHAAKPTLESHLMWQLRLSSLSDEQKEIGELVIGNLDSAGYLRASNEEIAELGRVSPSEVEPVVRAVQRFDPVGVASRSPQECLLVQIEVLKYDRDPILDDLCASIWRIWKTGVISRFCASSGWIWTRSRNTLT